MRDLLLELLRRLEAVDDAHPEVGDSEVREALGMAVFDGFVRPQSGYELPESFAMNTPEGNRRVREALAWFLPAANSEAMRAGFVTFHQRLAAVQDYDVLTARGNDAEEYFGHSPPEEFDESGEAIAEAEEEAPTHEAAPFLIRATVFAAVRDGHRLVTFGLRPGGGSAGYDAAGLGGTPPTGAPRVERYPAALADHCGRSHRARGRLTRWSRRWWGGSEDGSFPVAVGPGTAAVEYRARWSGGAIEELTISVAANDAATAEAAGAALREVLHPGGVEFD